jgi:hypothetical protein
MPLGQPAIPGVRTLALRDVQGAIDRIRERFAAVEIQVATTTAQAGQTTLTLGQSNASISNLQRQVSALVTRLDALPTPTDRLETFIAAAAIEQYDPVYVTAAGYVLPASATEINAAYGVIGVATTGAALGGNVVVRKSGTMQIAGAVFEPGGPVYVGLGGLTQFPDYVGVAVPVGVAVGTDRLDVTPGWPALQYPGVYSEFETFLPATWGLVRNAVELTDDFNSAANGIVAKTGFGDVSTRTLQQPAAGVTITNPAGIAGDPTFALANDLAALEALGSTGIAVRTAADTWAQRAVTGTADRVSVTNGNGVTGDPTVDIAATYVGQTSITTLGTVATGVWQGTAVGSTFGGTAQTTWATGDLLYASGTNTLAKRTIGATGDVLTVSGGVPTWAAPATSGTVTSVAASGTQGVTISGSPITSSGTITVGLGAITPTSVAASGAVSGSNLSGTNTGDQTITLTGDVTGSGTGSFATTLATVNSNVGSFGSSTAIPNFTVNAKGLITAAGSVAVVAPAGTLTGTTLAANVVTSSLTSVGTLGSLAVTGTATAGAFSGPLTGNVTGNVSGTSGSTTGNAATATALQTARTINGTSFDGTVDITVTAAAGTLTGTALPATVTGSSLTSVGTIGTGVWQGTAVAANFGGTGFTSYAVGDILFASTTSALSKLAGVATGNALISGGVNTAPSWGKIGLATHVSGNLPVTNLNSGTGADSSTFWRGDGAWATPAGSSGANPSASVGLAAVNGVATTFMRSDGAPALDAGISPTWSGAHTFSNSVTGASFIPTSATVPTNGMYLSGANAPAVASNGNARLVFESGGVVRPGGNGTQNLGSASFLWNDYRGVTATFTSTVTAAKFEPTSSAAPTNGLYLSAANSVALSTNSSKRFEIDSSGSAAIGGTPPTLSNVAPILQVRGSDATHSGGLSVISQDGGSWATLYSGSASGDSPSVNYPSTGLRFAKTTNAGIGGYVEHMRLDGLGNVGIGTTTPSSYGAGYTVCEVYGYNGGLVQAGSGSVLGEVYSAAGLQVEVGARSNHPLVLKTNDVAKVLIDTGGQVALQTVGKGLSIKEGTNAKMGISTMVGGAVVVGTTAVTASSRIMLTPQNTSGGAGSVSVSVRTAGTSFTISSTNALDTRDVAWIIFEPS